MNRFLLAMLLSAALPASVFAATSKPTTSSKPTTIATSKPAADPSHALLLRNGKIIDGAGNPWFYGDLLIRGGKIAEIGKLAAQAGLEEIDATGLVVAPGFIDVHTHVDKAIHESPLAENFVRNGVTTIVTGNCGSSVTDVGNYFWRLRKHG